MKDWESMKRDFGTSSDDSACEVQLRMPYGPESSIYDAEDSTVNIPR